MMAARGKESARIMTGLFSKKPECPLGALRQRFTFKRHFAGKVAGKSSWSRSIRETQSLESQPERLKGFFIASCEEVDFAVSGAATRQLDRTWLVACFAVTPGVEGSDPSVIVAAANR
jgi:hypothetical protein